VAIEVGKRCVSGGAAQKCGRWISYKLFHDNLYQWSDHKVLSNIRWQLYAG
jgi:hypothetical protein